MWFKNTMASPPGGVYFCEVGGERVQATNWPSMEAKVARILARIGSTDSPEQVVADYMCPRLPGSEWFCAGSGAKVPALFKADVLAGSLPYGSRQVVPFDVISRRLRACAECPKHRRDWCLTCTGHGDRIMVSFGGRRPALPEDRGSGVCMCSKAYEMAVASVEYGADEPVWEGAPGTCWRFHDV